MKQERPGPIVFSGSPRVDCYQIKSAQQPIGELQARLKDLRSRLSKPYQPLVANVLSYTETREAWHHQHDGFLSLNKAMLGLAALVLNRLAKKRPLVGKLLGLGRDFSVLSHHTAKGFGKPDSPYSPSSVPEQITHLYFPTSSQMPFYPANSTALVELDFSLVTSQPELLQLIKAFSSGNTSFAKRSPAVRLWVAYSYMACRPAQELLFVGNNPGPLLRNTDLKGAHVPGLVDWSASPWNKNLMVFNPNEGSPVELFVHHGYNGQPQAWANLRHQVCNRRGAWVPYRHLLNVHPEIEPEIVGASRVSLNALMCRL